MNDARADDIADRAEKALLEYLLRQQEGHAEPVDEFLDAHAALRPLLDRLWQEQERADALLRAGNKDPRQIGDFRIRHELGHGGMGVVYLADQQSLQRAVALKILPPQFSLSPRQIERFQREARAVARLRHPGIAPIYVVGEDESRHYYAMEYVAGGSLHAVLEKLRARPRRSRSLRIHGVLGPGNKAYAAEVAELVAQVADALHYAHGEGIIHRDVKPHNILLSEDGNPKLVDFGLAMDLNRSVLSQTGEIAGTPFYMSPEQAAGVRTNIDARTDVFSLGIVLYELLTLRRPFAGKTSHEVLHAISHRDPPPISHSNPSVPRELEWICQKSLEKDRRHRYASAGAFAQDLRRFLSFEPIEAKPAGVWIRARKWARRHRAVTVTASIVTITMIALLITSFWQRQQKQRRIHRLLEEGEQFSQQGQYERAIDRVVEALRFDPVDPRPEARLRVYRKELELQRSEGLRLLAQAELQRRNNPDLGLILAVEGARRSPGLIANNTLLAALDDRPEQHTLVGHEGETTAALFITDGRRVVSAGYDETVRIWDAQTGETLATLAIGEPILDIDVDASEHHLVTVLPQTVKLWTFPAGEPIRSLTSCDAGISSVQFHPFDDRVLIAARDGSARIVESSTGEELVRVLGSSATLFAGFHPRGTQFVTTYADGMVKTWVTIDGTPIQEFAGHHGAVNHAGFSPDGRQLVTAGDDGQARLWTVATGKTRDLTLTHRDVVTWAEFDPAGKRLVTASGYNPFYGTDRPTAVIWNTSDGAEIKRLRGHESNLTSARFDPSGTWVLTASSDGMPRIWQSHKNRGYGDLVMGVDWVNGAAVSPDGKKFAFVPWDQSGHPGATVWSYTAPDSYHQLAHLSSTATIASLHFDAEGERLAAAGADGSVTIFSADGREQQRFQAHHGECLYAEFSPQGSRVVTAGSHDRTARVFELENPARVVELAGHQGQVSCARFSPDGSRVATASGEDRTIRIWDAQTGDQRQRIPWTFDRGTFSWPLVMMGVAFTPDGKRIIFADGNDARIVDANDGKQLQRLDGHSQPVLSVDVSSDQKLAVTSSMDGTARLWNLESGETCSVLKGHLAAVSLATFTADGESVLTISAWPPDRTARLWPIDALAAARRHLPRQLTESERRRFGLGQ